MLHKCKTVFPLACLLLAATALPVYAASDAPEYVVHQNYKIAADASNILMITEDVRVARKRDIDGDGRYSFTFDPDSQKFKIIEAWVDQVDGTRVNVDPKTVLVRPSAASRGAPGFTSSKTATLLFPQIVVGSKTHVKVQLTTFKPSPQGFNDIFAGTLYYAGDVYVSVDAPKSLNLKIGQTKSNGFKIKDETTGDKRHIEAKFHIRGVSPDDQEDYMLSDADMRSALFLSSLKNYQDLGDRLYKLSSGKAKVTPEIQALADKITEGKQGKQAAQALYDWVAKNIRYIALYLNPNEGWVSHDAATVLRNGFGDCKDKVVILQALLAAKNIKSEPVLVNWSGAYNAPPIATAYAFNHEIIYLPEYKIYANPTGQTTPFGVLNDGLRGKLVLHMNAHPYTSITPVLTPEDASFSTKGNITIDKDGTIKGTANVTMSPFLEPSLRRGLMDKTGRDNIAKKITADLPHHGVGHIKSSDAQDLDTPLTLSLDWKSVNAVVPDSAGFVMPSLPMALDPLSPADMLNTDKKRKFPIALPIAQVQTHFTISPPAGFTFKFIPKNVHADNAAALYDATYKANGNKIVVDRKLVIKTRQIAAKDDELVKQISRAVLRDSSAIVSLKKQ